MNPEALFLFLILLLGLILCSFLGGNCQSGRVEGFDNLSLYDASGNKNVEKAPKNIIGIITAPDNADGTNSNSINSTLDTSNAHHTTTHPSHHHHYETPKYDNYNHYHKKSTPSIYYGPNGSTAKIMNTHGIYTVIATDKNGNVSTYHPKSKSKNTHMSIHPHSNIHPPSNTHPISQDTTYHSPTGGTAVIGNDFTTGVKIIKVTDTTGNTTIYSSTNSQTFNAGYDNPPPVQTSSSSSDYSGAYGGNIGTSFMSGPGGNNNAYPTNTPMTNPNKINTSLNATGKYNSSLPQGIPKSMIPPGNEDLYILKSEVVPPVCPSCPAPIMSSSSSKNDSSQCAPCPGPARCPEPSFTCQKVPNYTAGQDNQYLPVPVLSSFTSFGM